ERWRARATVQIFVRTADREIDVVSIEAEIHRADAVAQIHTRQRPGLMRGTNDPGDVPGLARAIVDRRHRDETHVITPCGEHGRNLRWARPYDRPSPDVRCRLGDVEIGGKRRSIRDEQASIWTHPNRCR